MTTKAEFTTDEWDSLVQLPRWVCAAASAAQRDLAYRTKAEVEVGLLSSAHGRNMGNAFLAEVFATVEDHIVRFANPLQGRDATNTVYVATTGSG